MPQVYKGTLKKPRTIGEKITQAFVDYVEEVNARSSVHGNPPVYDVNLFPGQKSWKKTIRSSAKSWTPS
jgi:hypothetical protein